MKAASLILLALMASPFGATAGVPTGRFGQGGVGPTRDVVIAADGRTAVWEIRDCGTCKAQRSATEPVKDIGEGRVEIGGAQFDVGKGGVSLFHPSMGDFRKVANH